MGVNFTSVKDMFGWVGPVLMALPPRACLTICLVARGEVYVVRHTGDPT